MLRVVLTDDPAADAIRFSPDQATLTISRPKAREVLGESATDADIERRGREELDALHAL